MWFSDAFVQMRSVYLKCTQLSLTFEYFELNNILFGQLGYWSVVTLPHIPKDHISRNMCINWEISNIVDWIFSGPEILWKERSSI